MTDNRAKHILVSIEDDFQSDSAIFSVLDRFVNQYDMIFIKTYNKVIADYADECGCPLTLYDKLPDTINFILAFAMTEDFVLAVLNKAGAIGKIAIVTKCP